MDYKETIKERLGLLPESLKAYIIDENWRRDAENTSKQFNLDEEKYASFENEVFLVLLCFEPKTDFVENLKNELGVDANITGFIAEDVNKNIFSKVSGELDAIWKEIEKGEEKQTEPQTQSNVGSDFEQIILNQAKAMRPAVPANLPTEQSEPKKIHDYPPDNDPYREPLA